MSYTDKMQDAAKNFAKSVNPDFVRALGGGGSGILFANVDKATATLDKTWQEVASVNVAYLVTRDGVRTMKLPVIDTFADASHNTYYVVAIGVAEATGEGDKLEFQLRPFVFKATSADGYPTFAV